MDQNSSQTVSAGPTSASTTLYIEIDPAFDGALSNPTLVIGSDSYSLDLSLGPGDRTEIQNVPAPASSSTPVFLSFTLDGLRSVSSPLLVVKN